MCVRAVGLTQNLLGRRQDEAGGGGVLRVGRGASALQRAHQLPEKRHLLPESVDVLLPLLLGDRGGVHFEVEDSGGDGVVVSLRETERRTS